MNAASMIIPKMHMLTGLPQDMFKDLVKKKKKKPKKDDADDADGEKPAADGDELDMSALTKKKKKKKPKADDFDAQLAEAGDGETIAKPDNKNASQDGDMMKGTGIWA